MQIKTGLCIFFVLLFTTACLPEYKPGIQERTDIATVIFPHGEKYQCQIADDYLERSTGLKNTPSLPEGTGMVFIYPRPSATSFWMPPNMTYSLDMLFLDENRRIIHIARDAEPCKDPSGYDCPTYSPQALVSFVIEIPAGSAKNLLLEIGQQVQIVLPDKSE